MSGQRIVRGCITFENFIALGKTMGAGSNGTHCQNACDVGMHLFDSDIASYTILPNRFSAHLVIHTSKQMVYFAFQLRESRGTKQFETLFEKERLNPCIRMTRESCEGEPEHVYKVSTAANEVDKHSSHPALQ